MPEPMSATRWGVRAVDASVRIHINGLRFDFGPQAAFDLAQTIRVILGIETPGAPETPGDAEGPQAEGEPGTYWERATLERFVTGREVDVQTVRQQLAALLAETPVRSCTPGDAEEAAGVNRPGLAHGQGR